MPGRERMSSRERVRRALAHQTTDRVPIAMICSGINEPARVALEVYLRRERGTGVDAWLKPFIDIREVAPRYIGPPLREGEDIWGVHRGVIGYGNGTGEYHEIDHYPLAGARTAADLDRHRWPSTDWFDYSVLPERIAALRSDGDPAIMVANGNLFESSWYMRGFERTLADLLEEPEFVRDLLDRVTTFHIAHFRKILAAANGGIDLVFTADDIGGQQGLLMSLKTWETLIKPFHVRLNRAIHEFGARVVYHSDGDVMDAAGGLVDMGIDVLEALQFNAGKMDPVALKAGWGGRLSFAGGVSVQATLPFGTADDVRNEVKRLITVLGKDGGYILGPSHLIQAGTPPENIVALFETAGSFYPY
ncbi:MAG: uroporphyrinogen decarboxylase family protein [Candidatus Coatesbacteria bacterium]